MNKRTIYGSALCCFITSMALFGSCKKNDFLGKDNFISSFKLKKGSTTFTAAITDSSIIIDAPEGFSLDSAVATVTLSEHASIYPDPAKIAGWNDESLFVVNSYDGMKKTFKYTVKRKDNSIDGSVVLAKQADVDAIAANGATEITGNLIIGSTGGTDSITNLNGLFKLKKIDYSLIIYPTFAASEIIGLDGLTTIGADLKIESVNDLVKVVLPSLESVRNISIKNPFTENIQFPKLTNVSQSLTISAPLNVLTLPNLQQIGTINLIADESQGSSLIPVIAFPSLTSVGDINIVGFKQATKLDFPVLTSCGGLSTSSLTALYDLSFPKLQRATGILTIPDDSKITLISFPSLTEAGGLNITGKTVNALEAPLLKIVGGDLLIGTGPNQQGLSTLPFPALETIGGQLRIYSEFAPVSYSTVLTNLDGFAALLHVQSIDISGQQALTSFAGLQHALPAVSIAGWNASDNAYDPSFDDLMAGKWTKP